MSSNLFLLPPTDPISHDAPRTSTPKQSTPEDGKGTKGKASKRKGNINGSSETKTPSKTNKNSDDTSTRSLTPWERAKLNAEARYVQEVARAERKFGTPAHDRKVLSESGEKKGKAKEVENRSEDLEVMDMDVDARNPRFHDQPDDELIHQLGLKSSDLNNQSQVNDDASIGGENTRRSNRDTEEHQTRWPLSKSAYLLAFQSLLDPVLEECLHYPCASSSSTESIENNFNNHNSRLLTLEEESFLRTWRLMSPGARYLWVRIWLRKGNGNTDGNGGGDSFGYEGVNLESSSEDNQGERKSSPSSSKFFRISRLREAYGFQFPTPQTRPPCPFSTLRSVSPSSSTSSVGCKMKKEVIIDQDPEQDHIRNSQPRPDNDGSNSTLASKEELDLDFDSCVQELINTRGPKDEKMVEVLDWDGDGKNESEIQVKCEEEWTSNESGEELVIVGMKEKGKGREEGSRRGRKSTEEVLDMLSGEEMKQLAKLLNIPNPGATRKSLQAAFKQSSSQSTLLNDSGTSPSSTSKTYPSGNEEAQGKGSRRELGLSYDEKGRKLGGDELLRRKAIDLIGPSIRLSTPLIDLFSLVHLIHNRATALPSLSSPQCAILPTLLSKFHKMHYFPYRITRSTTSNAFWKDRQELDDYQHALRLERRVEELLGELNGWDWKEEAARRAKMQGKDGWKERVQKEGMALWKTAWEKWKVCVEMKEAEAEEPGVEERKYFRKRFHPGWPLTRVLYKCETAFLAKSGVYELCIEVLEALLAQEHFRRGKRGEWYNRLALICMHHCHYRDESERKDADGKWKKKKKKRKRKSTDAGKVHEDDEGATSDNDNETRNQWRWKALEVCKTGLEDTDTHLIYHHSLRRRILRLQTLLRIPSCDHYSFESSKVVPLQEATERIMTGERVIVPERSNLGKSSWRLCDGAVGSVEALVLEGYEREGWKGFHSENGILTTLFALLFFDIIFLDGVEGAFETAYQSAPLDMATDAFYRARKNEIDAKLADIAAGKAINIISEIDDEERELRTCCVGLNWKRYEKQDLIEVAECLGAKALSAICTIYAQEWGSRVGGVPDLCLWKMSKKQARFVEVKGPGDRLSETQRVWVDVLLNAGVEVELCSIKELGLKEEEEVAQEAKRRRREDRSVSARPPRNKQQAGKKKKGAKNGNFCDKAENVGPSGANLPIIILD